MQDSLFDSEHDGNFGENANILMSVLNDYVSHSNAITAIGSAPYVERTRKQQLANMEQIISLAQKYDLDVDFHLDYDLKSCDGIEEQVESEPLIFPSSFLPVFNLDDGEIFDSGPHNSTQRFHASAHCASSRMSRNYSSFVCFAKRIVCGFAPERFVHDGSQTVLARGFRLFVRRPFDPSRHT